MKSKVSVSKVELRGVTSIRLVFQYDSEASEQIRKLNGSRWSSTYSSWLIPFEKASFDLLKEIFAEIICIDKECQSIMESPGHKEIIIKDEINKEEKTGEEVLMWQDQGYFYLKVNAYNQKDRSYLAGIEYSRNFLSSGYWKIRSTERTASLLKAYFIGRLRKWPSLIGEINEYEEKQRDKYKITAVIAGKQVRVIFDWNKQVIDFLKTMPFHHWDPNNKWWSFAYNEKTLKALKDFCSEKKFDLRIDSVQVLKTVMKRAVDYKDPSYRKCPPEMIDKLKNKRYSESTIRQYVSMFEEFINYHRKLALEDLGTAEIKQFVGYLVQVRKVSPSYQNVAVNAIKFYYEKVLGGPRRFIDIDRPRREKHLPEVLSRAEVISMISSIANLKHKFILILLYSTGLRRGELLQLRINDIDRDNMKIWVRGGKGKKDRYVQLG